MRLFKPAFRPRQRSIKLYEMFMRDGLQSLQVCYPLETKIKFANLLSGCNFDYIELGSTTNPKKIPQMQDSEKLFSQVNLNPLTDYGMLVPSYSHTHKVLEQGIKSFGLVCSISETFARKNLKKTSDQSVEEVLKQMDLILQHKSNISVCPHIRVYLSGAFGSPWEPFDPPYLLNLIFTMRKFVGVANQYNLEPDNFDLVISDTFGLSDYTRTYTILNLIREYFYSETNEYFAMHIHSKDDNWKKLIENCFNNSICKFDCSMGGIGGCPYAEDHALGNISTVQLVKYLQNNGFGKNYDLDLLTETESTIKSYM
jgi:hydroxymethylglutaryl-CoA lyase